MHTATEAHCVASSREFLGARCSQAKRDPQRLLFTTDDGALVHTGLMPKYVLGTRCLPAKSTPRLALSERLGAHVLLAARDPRCTMVRNYKGSSVLALWALMVIDYTRSLVHSVGKPGSTFDAQCFHTK